MAYHANNPKKRVPSVRVKKDPGYEGAGGPKKEFYLVENNAGDDSDFDDSGNSGEDGNGKDSGDSDYNDDE